MLLPYSAADRALLQWRGDLQSLEQALEAAGWKAAPPWSIDALNGFAFPNTAATALPAAPKFHDGRREVFTALHPIDNGQSRLVLRVWPESVRDPAGRSENFYVGAVVRERVEHPFDQLSIPLRAVVFNRMHQEAATDFRRMDEDWLRELVQRAVKRSDRAERLVDNFLRYETQARGDQVRMEAFRRQLPGRPAVAIVPDFEEDLHDLDGLRRMLPHLIAA